MLSSPSLSSPLYSRDGLIIFLFGSAVRHYFLELGEVRSMVSRRRFASPLILKSVLKRSTLLVGKDS
jgi:hypothetical protein